MAKCISNNDEETTNQNDIIASIQTDVVLDPASKDHNETRPPSTAVLHQNMPNFYVIEQVNSKRRALDVKVFRQFSISAAEFLISANNKRDNDNCNCDDGSKVTLDPCNTLTGGEASITCRRTVKLMTEEEAIDLLMPGYDEFGNYILQSAATTTSTTIATSAAATSSFPSTNSEVYFVAVLNDDDANGKDFNNQNGVVGVVSAKLHHFPSPHVYLANMRVHPLVQRRGIGSALLSSVCQYAESLHVLSNKQYYDGNCNDGTLKCQKVVLSVDNDNSQAITMYEKFGFRYLERNEVFGVMEFPLR